jgi:ABC-type antimicrobial peptide transport system permease subunit
MITLLSADLQRQRRAIAIRRVFGAHYRDCLRRTLRTYGVISALGTTIGLCIGYYLMTLWLRTYTLQISLGFLPALGIIALIAIIITALVAYKVKVCFKENPAEVITG